MKQPPRILYLTHDLADATTQKRVIMLQDGGAQVSLGGFRRSSTPISMLLDIPVIDFGQTHNGKFLQRLASIIHQILLLKKHKVVFNSADVILARNLETLAIAVRGRSLCSKKTLLVYESLDIHRLLLRDDAIGKLLRKLEGWLAKRASAIVTSSPAFISEYIHKRSQIHLPIRLLENKVYMQERPASINLPPRVAGSSWKIGWFGAIRCRKSLDILTSLVKQSDGNIEVIIRGKPSLDQFDDFYKQTSQTPGLRFLGPYKNPDNLVQMYQEVHFTWAIDMFEEGLNSSWLLPNRVYEGGLYGCVPLSVSGVETNRFLSSLGIGVTLEHPLLESLIKFFRNLSDEKYQEHEKECKKIPLNTWVYDRQDVGDFVDYLASLTPAA